MNRNKKSIITAGYDCDCDDQYTVVITYSLAISIIVNDIHHILKVFES